MRIVVSTASIMSKLQKIAPVLTILLLTHLIQLPSEAQQSPDQTPVLQPVNPLIPFSRRWDINGDGISTCQEWKLFMVKVFHKADRNRNKVLEESEMSNVIAADPIFSDSSLGYFDMNNDGVLTLTEFIDRPSPFFFVYDADKDCRVTRSEQDVRGK
jgi:hypothetical protein